MNDTAGIHTRAFGMEIDSGFDLPGFTARPPAEGSRRLRLELAPAVLNGAGQDEAPARLGAVEGPDGRPLATIDATADGYRIWAETLGYALVAEDGSEVLVSPAEGPEWVWQRYLTGQVLPFAAVLQGLEVFHSSVVEVDGRAIAVMAQSGVGKTSLALNMALLGAGFLADDVAVTEPDGEGLLVHPGVGIANVPREAADLARAVERAGLGGPVGKSEHEIRLRIRCHDRSVPLGAVFFVHRLASGDRAVIEHLSPVDPRLILAATFNFVLRDPDRLLRHFDACWLMARSVPVHSVDCPPAVDAPELADQILAAARAPEPA
jgi:hypothetical protein